MSACWLASAAVSKRCWVLRQQTKMRSVGVSLRLAIERDPMEVNDEDAVAIAVAGDVDVDVACSCVGDGARTGNPARHRRALDEVFRRDEESLPLGVANIVHVQLAYEGATPASDAQSILPRMVKGLKGQTLDSVRDGLTKWYAEHPNQMQRPVIETLWFEMVVPGLKKAG
jgi:hypothetical protein